MLRGSRGTFILIMIIFFTGVFLRMANADLTDPAYLDSEGLQYFQESDSYYNYRLTCNVLMRGHPGDAIINGLEWDLHSYYPPGVPLDYPPALPFVTVFIYHMVDLFASISLRSICMVLPALIAPAAGILVFLLVRRSQDWLPAFLAGILMVSAPLYLLRTNYGFYDTDMFNLIFPLAFLLVLAEADSVKVERHRIILSSIAGFIMFTYSISWSGWQIIFYMTFITFFIMLIHMKSTDMGKVLRTFLPAFAVLFMFLIIFNRLEFLKFITAPFHLSDLAGNTDVWYPFPDSYLNVAELQRTSPEDTLIILSPVLILMGFSGFILMNLRSRSAGWSRLMQIFISVWTVSFILLSLTGGRFLMFSVPPMSVLAGLFMGIFLDYTGSYSRGWIRPLFSIILILTVFTQVAASYMIIDNLKPRYDDCFEDSARWIAENTSPDAVIITDWSYGHFYASEAGRPVLYDGRLAYIETLPARELWYDDSLNPEIPSTARDYWVNLALGTSNPKLSTNIFRMLGNSGDDAYLTLENYTGDRDLSFRILKRILALDREEARGVLIKDYGFSETEASSILNKSHPVSSREIIVVVPWKMIGIASGMFKAIYYPSESSPVFCRFNGTLNNEIYSVIEFDPDDGVTERILNASGNLSVVSIHGREYLMDRNYTDSVILKLLMGEKEDGFIPCYRNRFINVYRV